MAIRNIRRDANDTFKKQEKANEISEDDLEEVTDKIQKLTDKMIEKVDKAIDSKTRRLYGVTTIRSEVRLLSLPVWDLRHTVLGFRAHWEEKGLWQI